MNSTVTKLSDLAWSKLDNLSRMRKFIEGEIDHSHSFSPAIPPEKLQQSLDKIDRFAVEFSRFLSIKCSQRHQPDTLEEKFDELSDRHSLLMQELENLIQP